MPDAIAHFGLAELASSRSKAALLQNRPVLITLAKTGDTYAVPAGAKLAEPQPANCRAGNLYLCVCIKANPGGEIRGQLKP